MKKENLLSLQNGSDIRGIACEGVKGEKVNLTEEDVRLISRAFSFWLSKKTGKKTEELKIGIGRDARITGEKLLHEAAIGINSSGATCIDCGLSTTPAMFMGLVFKETKFDGSLMITASHLPFNRNGMKFFLSDGGLEKEDIEEILKESSSMFFNFESQSPLLEKCDLLSLYSSHLRLSICHELGCKEEDKPLTGLKIIVDAGNGDAGFFVSEILSPLGADTKGSQFLEPDGMFPNHIPNPENKDAMESITIAAVKNESDLALIFDTDVDRMSAVLSGGKAINRDLIIALFSAILAPSFPGSTIITDSVTSDRLTFFLEKKLGLKHLRYMRGYKNVIDKCKELNKNGIVSPLAMETSGHGALKDNFYLDDGAFLAVLLISSLAKAKKNGNKIEDLIKDFPPAGCEKEYRLSIKASDFKSYGKKVLDIFRSRAKEKGFSLPETAEGVRISFQEEGKEGWLLLRMSLHDPVMPLNIEGKTEKDKDAIVFSAKELLLGFEELDINSL